MPGNTREFVVPSDEIPHKWQPPSRPLPFFFSQTSPPQRFGQGLACSLPSAGQNCVSAKYVSFLHKQDFPRLDNDRFD